MVPAVPGSAGRVLGVTVHGNPRADNQNQDNAELFSHDGSLCGPVLEFFLEETRVGEPQYSSK